MGTVASPSLIARRFPVRLQQATLHWATLAQIAVCTVPPMALVYVGQPRLAARVLVGLLGVVMGFAVLRGKRYELAATAIGCLPVLGLLRGLFFYYSGLCILGGGIVMWALHEPEGLRRLWNDLAWRSLAIFSVFYWWLCILITGDKVTELRFFELTLSSACILLMSDRRSYLATALLGMWFSTTFVAVALMPYGDRLGLAFIDDVRIGNPILLGVPSALVLMLVLADGGRWLLLQKRPVVRVILALAMIVWLLLSGSRGSWIAAGCGLLMLPFTSKGDRRILVALAIVALLVTTAVLATSRGVTITNQFERTIDSERSLAKRTSGRSEQWLALPAVFASSPLWGWGPGTGRDVAYQFMGRHLEWHSLYLQFVADAGMLGAAALIWFMTVLIIRGVRHYQQYKEIVPLLCVFIYLIIAASVQGVDAISGVFIGLALLTIDPLPKYRVAQTFRLRSSKMNPWRQR